MSYDGWIEMPDPDGGDPVTLHEIGNYTSNVSRMWEWCLSVVTESPLRLSETDGWTCEEAAPVLAKAAAVMAENRSRLSEWNPANGWGNYDGALGYLHRTSEAARLYRAVPGSYIRWWV